MPKDIAIFAPSEEAIWTGQPAPVTEVFGTTIHRIPVKLAGFSTVRLTGNIGSVPAFTGAVAALQYSVIGDFSDAAYLDGAAGPQLAIDATGSFAGTAVIIEDAAKIAAGVTLRLVGEGGNLIVDPTLGRFSAQFFE